MFFDIPLIGASVKILRFWSLLYEHNMRRYVCLSLSTFLVFTQVIYMFCTAEGIVGVIRNSYMLVLWFNTILRACLLVYDGAKYESFIADLRTYYNELKKSKDFYIQNLLLETNNKGHKMARGNLFLGLLSCIGFGCYPLFTAERVLPFGSMIPGIDEYSSPYYQILYVYQMLITPMGCCMYIPYTSLIVAFIMFGIVMCKALQHRLGKLKGSRLTKDHIRSEIVECIKQQVAIINYITALNQLTTYIFLLEFLAVGALLCALLFLLNFIDSNVQMVIVCAYITMILAQIFALYWYANELREQCLGVAVAAYETDWFTFEVPMQKHILLIMLRAQRPCSITIGNIRPMTLELFQNLLNASYTYFTVLKRVYA